MIDTLDPKTLNAEERALLDRHASKLYAEQPGCGGDAAGAYADGLRLIEARRALFSPAQPEPEPKECRNCGELTTESHQHSDDGKTFCYTCQKPELKREEAVCPNCRQRVLFAKAHRLLDGSGGYTCKPAPHPAPVATRFKCDRCGEPLGGNESHRVAFNTVDKAYREQISYRYTCELPLPAPAASELPEAVADAIDAITDAYNETDDGYGCAAALEAWARSQQAADASSMWDKGFAAGIALQEKCDAQSKAVPDYILRVLRNVADNGGELESTASRKDIRRWLAQAEGE